jgi:hypothetical protein
VKTNVQLIDALAKRLELIAVIIANHLDTNFEPHIDSKHAGFADINYRKRRLQIANIALAYKQYSQFKLKIILKYF